MKKILAVFAHGNDVLFGPAATLAKYADKGVKVHLAIAVAQRLAPEKTPTDNFDWWQMAEIKKAAKTLGIRNLHFFNLPADSLSQNSVKILRDKITEIIDKVSPQILMTFDPAGLSRHIDHIVVSIAVSEVYETALKSPKSEKNTTPSKLYHYVIPESIQQKFELEIESFPDERITTVIDTKDFNRVRIKALESHPEPGSHARKLIAMFKATDHHYDFFHLVQTQLPLLGHKETDLFERLK